MSLNNKLLKVIKEFKIVGEVQSIEPYGEGHINITYLVTTNKKRYILQKINHNLFKNIDELMSNISLVCEHIRHNYPRKLALSLVFTLSNQCYYNDNEGYYRVYDFIEHSVCLQIVENEKEFYECAKAFGDFSNMLSTFDASKLYEVIPNFHNTVSRYQDFKKACNNDIMSRKSKVLEEISFVNIRKELCDKICDLLEKGLMPIKVTHNDTKLNNVLLDENTYECLAVIDLDTIMPGSICYDFGDSIRFGCNSSKEDECDLSKVNFRLDLFEVFVKGYIETLHDSITEIEKDNLSYGAILMTFECGMRFLTDYLNGDTYFKIHRENHNLDRARTQFKLVQDMEDNIQKMDNIVDKYYNMYK